MGERSSETKATAEDEDRVTKFMADWRCGPDELVDEMFRDLLRLISEVRREGYREGYSQGYRDGCVDTQEAHEVEQVRREAKVDHV